MKKFVFYLCLLLIAFPAGCTTTTSNTVSTSFRGEVAQVTMDSLLVLGMEDLFQKVNVKVAPETRIEFQDGSRGSIENIKTNDKLRIDFDGVIAESTPPQIKAEKIKIERTN